MNKVSLRGLQLLQKTAATKWKHVWQNLSDESKDTILKKVSDPMVLAEKSENTFKSIAKKQGFKPYTDLDKFVKDTGLPKKNFVTYDKQRVVVADKKAGIKELTNLGLPLDFAKRQAATSQMHEAYETLSAKRRPYFSRYDTHYGPGVVHRESAYIARLPKIDRMVAKNMSKTRKTMDIETANSFCNNPNDNKQKAYLRATAKKYRDSKSVYDDMLSYGVDFAESPIINKKALKKHRENFSLTEGYPMSEQEIQDFKRRKKLLEDILKKRR